MKRLFTLLLTAVVALAGAAQMRDYDKSCHKWAEQTAKNFYKETIKKGKYTLNAPMAPIDELKRFFLKGSDCDHYTAEVQMVQKAKTVAAGENTASLLATNKLLQELYAVGVGAASLSIDTDIAEDASAKVMSDYQGVAAGCISRMSSFYRKNLDGSVEVHALILIDKDRVQAARDRVARDAKDENGKLYKRLAALAGETNPADAD